MLQKQIYIMSENPTKMAANCNHMAERNRHAMPACSYLIGMAWKRSLFSSSLAVMQLPSAVTISYLVQVWWNMPHLWLVDSSPPPATSPPMVRTSSSGTTGRVTPYLTIILFRNPMVIPGSTVTSIFCLSTYRRLITKLGVFELTFNMSIISSSLTLYSLSL